MIQTTAATADAWSIGLRPQTDMHPLDWLERHVVIPHGQPTRFDRETAPHLREPLAAILDNRNRQVCCLAAIGTSKTTLMEVALPYIIAEDSGPTMVATQSDEEAKTWAETRLGPMLSSIEPVNALLPGNRHKTRTTEILFPHMPLLIGGAKKSFLQAKSMRWVFGDEVWLWRKDRIRELKGRTHDRWNARVVLLSQGGEEGDDWHAEWQGTDQRMLGLICPSCREWHEWSWTMIKYDQERDAEGNWNWGKVSRSVRYQLPCGAVFDNSARNRHRFAAAGEYRPTNPDHIPGHVGFWWPFFAAPRIDPAKVVVEWIRANHGEEGAVYDGLKVFLQKRMAQFWRLDAAEEDIELAPSGYLISDYETGELIDGEARRFLTLDTQEDHFWGVARAWRTDGSSRLLWCGKLWQASDVEDVREKYDITPGLTFIDSHYQPAVVHALCEQYGWTSVVGTAQTYHVHKVRGRSIKRLWTRPQKIRAGGKSIVHYGIAVEAVKDVLAQLRAGKLAAWEQPDDVDDKWRQHMGSEAKVTHTDPKTGRVKKGWRQIRKHNHMWDCEVYQTFGAMLFSLIRPAEIEPDDPVVDNEH